MPLHPSQAPPPILSAYFQPNFKLSIIPPPALLISLVMCLFTPPPPSPHLIFKSWSFCATLSRLWCACPNLSVLPHKSSVSFPRFRFSILFLLCRFQFLKASLRWMANGAPLRSSERKQENEMHKGEMGGDTKKKKRTEPLYFPLDNWVFWLSCAIPCKLPVKLASQINSVS